jgi:hypothetical protein
MLWLLYYYDGKWYRLDYVYLSPFSSGVGVYIITGSGIYKGYSGTLNNPTPQYIDLSQTGFQLGMWFKVINVQQSPTHLLNATFTPTGHKPGEKFSVILYTKGSSLYVEVYDPGPPPPPPPGQKLVLLYNNLKAGQSYFINFTTGKQFRLGNAVKFTIYNEQGQLLNSSVLNLPPGLPPSGINGYTLILTFGSKTISNGIYQAFIETLKNPQGTNSFWSISSFILHNGPLYNDTDRFNQTVAQNSNLDSSAYWYFVWPYNNPPPQLPGILWYWPPGPSKYSHIYYITETGTNTYVVV